MPVDPSKDKGHKPKYQSVRKAIKELRLNEEEAKKKEIPNHEEDNAKKSASR